MDFDRVPDRINSIQTCYCWYHGSEPDEKLRPLFREDQMLAVSCPDACPKLVADFNRAGGLVLPYISTYKAPILEEVPDGDDWNMWEGGSPARGSARANPFWQAVELSEHPDWILRDEQGRPRRPFEDPGYMPGWYQSNPFAEDYCQAVLRGVRAVVADPRFDGVFYDNFFTYRDPSSTILKNNKLEAADMQNFEKVFHNLARSVRRTGDDATNGHFWILINGDINEVSEQIADVIAIESFVYSWARTDDVDDCQALEKLTSAKTLRSRGGRIIALSYFGFSGNNIAEDARRIRRLADQSQAILADCLTLARPAVCSYFARRNLAQGGGEVALKALQNEVAGDLEVAREVYRVE